MNNEPSTPTTAEGVLENDWEQAISLLDKRGHHHLAGCVQDLADEVLRLRAALTEIEKLANDGRDDAIDNRGHTIDLYEARQFEEIGAFVRAVMAA